MSDETSRKARPGTINHILKGNPVTFTLTINCGNAAFTDFAGQEIARILRELADKVAESAEVGDGWNLRDFNGNKVGEAYANE